MEFRGVSEDTPTHSDTVACLKLRSVAIDYMKSDLIGHAVTHYKPTVVSSQSLESSVSNHSHSLRSHATWSSSPKHLACTLYELPRQQPRAVVVAVRAVDLDVAVLDPEAPVHAFAHGLRVAGQVALVVGRRAVARAAARLRRGGRHHAALVVGLRLVRPAAAAAGRRRGGLSARSRSRRTSGPSLVLAPARQLSVRLGEVGQRGKRVCGAASGQQVRALGVVVRVCSESGGRRGAVSRSGDDFKGASCAWHSESGFGWGSGSKGAQKKGSSQAACVTVGSAVKK